MSSLQKRMGDEFIWGLKYRPRTIADMILPTRIQEYLINISDSIPNVLFNGSPGVGKTTAAIVLAEHKHRDTMFINCSEETSIDVVRGKMKQFCESQSMFSEEKKVVILDEVDQASSHFANAMKVFLEEYTKNTSFIFITNHKNKILEPLMSRLQVIDFIFTPEETKKLMPQCYSQVIKILKKEEAVYDQKLVGHIVKNIFPDVRKILNELQKHYIQNSLDNISHIKSVLCDVEEYAGLLKKRNFFGLLQYVNNLADPDTFFSTLYDSCLKISDKDTMGQYISIINESYVQVNTVSDVRLPIMSMSIKLMDEVKFK